MGSCCCNTLTEHEQNIDLYLLNNKLVQKQTISLLLIGPGGSGKSTILKQMQKLYCGDIPQSVLEDCSFFVKQKNIIEDILDLCKFHSHLVSESSKDAPQQQQHQYAQCQLQSKESLEIKTYLINAMIENQHQIQLDEELAPKLSVLFFDAGMQATFELRKKSHIMDNTRYFFENLERIAKPGYIATFEDFIRARQRTTGVIETSFNIVMNDMKTTLDLNRVDSVSNVSMDMDMDLGLQTMADDVVYENNNNNNHHNQNNSVSQTQNPNENQNQNQVKRNMWRFNFTDVGGQRTERKKWVKCFCDIDGVIYVMSLAAYDQVLYEAHDTNCLDEAFNLFESTFANPALANVSVIIFLNKNDLFELKILDVPFTIYDANFDSSFAHDQIEVINYVKHEFQTRYERAARKSKSKSNNKDKVEHKNINFHVTTATDTNQVETVMAVVQLQQIKLLVRQVSI